MFFHGLGSGLFRTGTVRALRHELRLLSFPFYFVYDRIVRRILPLTAANGICQKFRFTRQNDKGRMDPHLLSHRWPVFNSPPFA